MKLAGKIVLITGGASGIGKIMGRISLERGARLVIWDVSPENIGKALAEFDGLGQAHAYQVDVSAFDNIKLAADVVRSEVGEVDVLINNAGIVVGKYFHEHSSDELIRTMNINATALMLVTQAFLPSMMARRSGHICNITSAAGLTAVPKMSAYVSSKWAATGWSQSLRVEMKKLKTNVGVTTVMPYYINTGMFDGVKSNLIPILDPEKVSRKVIRAIERNTVNLSVPLPLGAIRLMQALLPPAAFDWLVGDVLGVYKTMDEFKGRSPSEQKSGPIVE